MKDTYPYLLFWEWDPSPTIPPGIACLSQWFLRDFTDPENHPKKKFKSSEHYMMYSKALLFDPPAAQAILDARTPAEAKASGREIKNFDRKVWDEKADWIVERGNYCKFREGGNGDMRGWLFDTVVDGDGDRLDSNKETMGVEKGKEEGMRKKILVECNPDDRKWGIGFSREDARARESEWGENRMGLALTRARDQLYKEEQERREA